MTKNIPVHKVTILGLLFIFFCEPLSASTEKTFYTPEEVRGFLEKNPTEPCTIHFIPQKSWSEKISNFFTEPFTRLCNRMSFKKVSIAVISGALGLGWVSYLLCTYLIYKAYRAAKKVHSLIPWHEDNTVLSDYDAFYRNPHRVSTFEKEKHILKAYILVNTFLKKHQIRHHFPHAGDLTQADIKQAHEKLEKAAELHSKNKTLR